MAKPPRLPSPPPDAADLRNAALRYVARHAASSARLRRVLRARLTRAALRHPEWAQDMARRAALSLAVETIVQEFTARSYVDDAGFAASKAHDWHQQGKSRRAVMSRLQREGFTAKDITAAINQAANGQDSTALEMEAAHQLARRKHLGPYRRNQDAMPDLRRAYAVFARAGFSRDIAQKVLQAAPEDGEA